MPGRATFRPLALALLGGLFSCGDAPATAPSGSGVGLLDVIPERLSLPVGGSHYLIVILRDLEGEPLPHSLLEWTNTAPAVAQVGLNGHLVARSPGSAMIIVRAEEKVDTTHLTVTAAPVASVSVVPSSLLLAVEESATLTATPLDGAGLPVLGVGVTWTSTDTARAKVSAAGVVTGVAPGTAQVRATAAGVTGSAAVTVTEEGGGTGAWPHEPAGFTPVSDQPWSLLTALGWVLQFGTASIGLDLGAPLSPPGVLTITYPAGFGGGEAPGTLTHGLLPSRQVFTGLWWKASDPWQGHESNVNKIQFIFAESGGDIFMAMYGPPGGPFQLRVIPQFPGLPSRWFEPNTSTTTVVLGEWHRIEWLIEYGETAGVGRVRWWLDGELIGDHADVPFPDAGLVDYKISPTWGGVGDVKEQTDYFWYDHVYLSRR